MVKFSSSEIQSEITHVCVSYEFFRTKTPVVYYEDGRFMSLVLDHKMVYKLGQCGTNNKVQF